MKFESDLFGDRISVLFEVNDTSHDIYKICINVYMIQRCIRSHMHQVSFNKCDRLLWSQFVYTFLSFTLSPVRREWDSKKKKNKKAHTHQTNYIINGASRHNLVPTILMHTIVWRFFSFFFIGLTIQLTNSYALRHQRQNQASYTHLWESRAM